jgi:hypothetical protein
VVRWAAVIAAPSAHCSQHPAREAVGICVRCRASMCSDCITKIDGINHCRACLDELTRSERKKHTDRARGLPSWLVLGVGIPLLTMLSYFMLDVVMPGSASP